MNGMATQKKQEAPLLPVYLIVGEDALKRDTVMKRLRARLSSMGDLSFNADEFDGETAQGGDIVTACNTVPFASPVRLVEVRAADKLKKADAEQLVSYLGSPNGSTVLALVAEKLAKNTRLYKAVAACGKTAVIDCAPLKRYELPRTVRSMAVTHGVTLTEGAAVKLVDLVGEDTVHLDSELKKIALAHRGTDAVNEHEIVDMVSRTAEVKPWEFVDAFAARDVRKCLLYLGRMDSDRAGAHRNGSGCPSRYPLHPRGYPQPWPPVLPDGAYTALPSASAWPYPYSGTGSAHSGRSPRSLWDNG